MTDIADFAQKLEDADRERALAIPLAAARRTMHAGDSGGLCAVCFHDIETERLAVLPGAIRCLTCQEAHERLRRTYSRS